MKNPLTTLLLIFFLSMPQSLGTITFIAHDLLYLVLFVFSETLLMDAINSFLFFDVLKTENL